MAIATYTVGQPVRITATFKVGSTLTNPTSVTVSVKDPDGVVSNPSATNDSTGIYHVDITPAKKGRYAYRVAGTGACIAAAEGEFNARTEF
jgi:hypothetical protein